MRVLYTVRMGEQEFLPPTSLHPDNEAPVGNCYSYVFYKLGLSDHNVSKLGIFHPQVELEARFFDVVDGFENADVLGIKDNYGTYAHMVLIDKERQNRLFHRTNEGRPIEETTSEKLLAEYPQSEFKVVWLRKK